MVPAPLEHLREVTLDAPRLAKPLAALLGGGAGGRPNLATGSGSDASKLGEALARVPALIRELWPQKE